MNSRIYFAALISILLTLFAWYSVKTSIELNDSTRFTARVDDVREKISFQMETYVNSLLQTRSFFEVAPEVSRPAFRDYIQSLHLQERYPGIQGIAYAQMIPASHLRDHIDRVRKSGFRDYQVWPPGTRTEYSSVVYIEPFTAKNQKAFGFDMLTDPVRREAMDSARDQGIPISSGLVTLAQDTEKDIQGDQQPGFLIYVPLYEKNMPQGSVEERRRALRGFLASPFRATDLFRAIFRSTLKNVPIDFEIYEGQLAVPKKIIFHQGGDGLSAAEVSRFQADVQLRVAGRPWLLRARSLPGFSPPWTRFAPLGVLFLGFFVAALVLYSMRAFHQELHSREELLKSQRRLNSEKEVLETIHHLGQSVAAELNLQKLVQAVTDAATKVCGAQFGAFFYNVAGPSGEIMTLYTISGVPFEAFSQFPLPRNTQVFDPTFKGAGIIRSDDITQDVRYGQNAPFFGMPKGHLPVVSYLAVPVISRTGEVLGGLFFGHEKAGVFSLREEEIVAGLAAQAAVGIDNARLYQKAQEAVRIRDEFLSIASHELKTPVTSLKMQIQLTQRAIQVEHGVSPSPERLAKAMAVSARQVDRLVGLVDNLLDVSKISSGKIEFTREAVDLVELTQNVLEQLSDTIRTASCDVTLLASGAVSIECDRFRIEQVITNLLTNALKYGAGQPVEISIGLAEGGQFAELRFKDSGIGIEKDKQDKIFERFERAISHSNISGLGLGLYISKQIVDAHRGSIRISSELGKGSVFVVSLPVEAIPADDAVSNV